jgi:hypothetical protein
MGGAARPGTLEGVRGDGAIVRVDPTTGYFGIRKGNTILTFFRPDDPMDYYMRQFPG